MRLTPGNSLTVPQVAERYAVDADCVRAWIKSKQLAAIDVSRNRGKLPRWRITPQALAEFEAARSSSPLSTAKSSRRIKRRRPADFIEYF
jgi:hypothetical protein